MTMHQKEYMSFPVGEYEARQRSLQADMLKSGIDIVLLSGRSNQRWLTGFSTLLAASPLRTCVTVVDARGGVSLVLPSDIEGIPNAYAGQMTLYDETTATSALLEVMDKHSGATTLRVGAELGRGSRLEMCQEDFEALRRGLGSAEIVDIVATMWKLRGEKSDAEMEKLSRACAITDEVWPKAFSELVPGTSEHAFAETLTARMCELGGESAYVDISAGRDRHLWANLPNRAGRLLGADDLVCVDGGCIVDGYYCDVQRMVTIRRPSDAFLGFVEAVGLASRAATRRLGPGVTGGDVYAAAAEEMNRLGYEGLLNNQAVGHAVGLDIHEVPEMGICSEERVSGRAMISIEPYTTHPQLGLYCLENNIAVEPEGTRVLTSMPWGLYCVEEQDWLACV